jgi:fructose-1,6-bisphosphatase/inositol monophosphatase family enzyme
MSDTYQYLDFAKQTAYEAGKIMLRYFGTRPEQSLKEDDTIVTVADTEVNRMVIERVQAAYPDHAVQGEEESHSKESDHIWVCDPIDGTNPYAMELPVSVFSLALVVDGTPVVGVIYDPFRDKLYAAEAGNGAFVNDTPLAVSQKGFGGKARMNFDWWPNAPYDILAPLKKLSEEQNVYLLSPGSTTHMAALVAEGEFLASVFAGTTGKNVDIAAAKVIVEEAGGKVTDLFGADQRYDADIKGAIVSNGLVHDDVVRYLAETINKDKEAA